MLVALSRLLLKLSVPLLAISACSMQGALPPGPGPHFAAENSAASAPTPGPMNAQIGRYAAMYRVPEGLIRRIIVRESGYNPRARNGPYWGLMQIRYDTARSMGYDGAPSGLLDADTNLRYAVKYLAGAYRVAGGNPDRAAAARSARSESAPRPVAAAVAAAASSSARAVLLNLPAWVSASATRALACFTWWRAWAIRGTK